MLSRSKAVLFSLSALLTLCSSIAGSPAFAQTARTAAPHVPGELLVHPKPGAPEFVLDKIFGQHGAFVKDAVRGIDVRVLKVPTDRLDHVQEALSRNPNFQFVEKNFLAEGAVTPNDSKYGSQWHLPKISAPQGWDFTTGDSQVIVAVIDSGVDPTHPDLAAKLLPGYNYLGGNTNTSDVLGHGTAVAGTSASLTNNTTGIAGVSWNSAILPLVVLDASNYASYANIASAIVYAADHGARVINISIGGSSSSSTMQNAVNYAWNKGAVIVACAMNNSSSTPMYPAALNNVLSVSATDSADRLASFSNYGGWIDISAPGTSILTTTRGGGYGAWQGTSFSSPIVAGVAALLFARKPSLTNAQVVDLLLENSDDLGPVGYDTFFGYGRVNAYKALLAAGTVNTPPPDATAPAVSIVAPTSGTTVTGTVSVTASASDNVGVSKVEIYLDGTLFATDTGSPYSFTWNTTLSTNGTHTLQALAYDAAGNTTLSTSVDVTVNNGAPDTISPTVVITSPTNGNTALRTVSIKVNAQDNVQVQTVEVYVDNKKIGMSTCAASSCTPSFTWNTRKAGSGAHTISAKAYDASGNQGVSSIVTVYK